MAAFQKVKNDLKSLIGKKCYVFITDLWLLEWSQEVRWFVTGHRDTLLPRHAVSCLLPRPSLSSLGCCRAVNDLLFLLMLYGQYAMSSRSQLGWSGQSQVLTRDQTLKQAGPLPRSKLKAKC